MHLIIAARIKNLFKLQDGEYIALEYLESIYKSCNLVHSVCVYAHSEARQPMAIIVPHEAQLRQLLIDKPLDNVVEKVSFEQLCKSDMVRKLVLNTCNMVGRNSGFNRKELLQAIVLSPIEWTPENGLTTAAQKLARKAILENFQTEIKVDRYCFSRSLADWMYRKSIRIERCVTCLCYKQL
jgi:long-chain acyl-CoA synthetase